MQKSKCGYVFLVYPSFPNGHPQAGPDTDDPEPYDSYVPIEQNEWNSSFGNVDCNDTPLIYPATKQKYDTVNNGTYKSGFNAPYGLLVGITLLTLGVALEILGVLAFVFLDIPTGITAQVNLKKQKENIMTAE